MITAEEARKNVRKFNISVRPEVFEVERICESIKVKSNCGETEYKTKLVLSRKRPDLLDKCSRMLVKLGFVVEASVDDVFGNDEIIYNLTIRW